VAFPVNPNSSQPPLIPSRAVPMQPQASPIPSASPPPQDQVQVNYQAAPPPVDAPQIFPSGLSIKKTAHNGQVTGLYATLPGGPGGLLAAPVLVSISLLPGQTTLGGQFQQANAYEMGADGKVARDAQGQPKQLPTTVMSDGRVYVQTDPGNPNAPLAMLDSDGSYGLATPARLKVEGDAAGNQGYMREQAEFIKPDNTRGFRVHEEVGAFGQAASGSGLTSLLTMGLASGPPAGSREVTYTEVQQNPQGALSSRDLHFSQGPGQNWPQFSLSSQWKSLLAMNAPDSRERSVLQEGPGLKLEGGWSGKRMLSLFTGQAGMGLNSWTYGKQETIYFIPLSRQRDMAPQGQPTPQTAGPAPQPSAPPPLPSDF